MPKSKSVLKRIRQNRKRYLENRSKKRRLRTMMKKLLTTDKREEAQKLLPMVQSIIDKSVQDRIIHKNTAARYKRKLYHHLASLP
ncbi:30S ribosomal protein S20 [candidate division WOR-3 bacterium]|uniref:Small ribosomal subunit protein bS20 n=1 Tax=candidate division WOR-3 bacterium TaxID=2052148 RepID=A0A660SLE9_UNCW3|nr:MAG: 30S ribosomal protein S20 [candidate division WOR-3 bacterium]